MQAPGYRANAAGSREVVDPGMDGCTSSPPPDAPADALGDDQHVGRAQGSRRLGVVPCTSIYGAGVAIVRRAPDPGARIRQLPQDMRDVPALSRSRASARSGFHEWTEVLSGRPEPRTH